MRATATRLQPARVGGARVDSRRAGAAAGQTVTFELAAASWDTRGRAARSGTYGSTRQGAFWRIPGLDAEPDRYVWWSHDDGTGRYVGYDPGDHVAALADHEGLEVQLAAGLRTAAQVATATRAACSAVFGAGGSGSRVSLTGQIDVENCEVGTTFTGRGAAGVHGSRLETPSNTGNPINDALCCHMTGPDGPVVVTAIGARLSQADPAQPVRYALYVGGSAASFTGTTLVAQGIVTGDGDGWVWLPLTAAQAAQLADNASVWLGLKCTTGGDTRAAYHAVGAAGSDLTAQNLTILDPGVGAGQIDPSEDVAWPASLAGIGSTNAFAVVLMMAIEYRTAPLVGDASWRGTLGVHSDDVLAGSESDLTSPDPGGANVLVGLMPPPILGMVGVRDEVAIGSVHTGQFRLGSYQGGDLEAPGGATRIRDNGQTTGTATNAWVGIDWPTGDDAIDVDPDQPLWMATRGNGAVRIRFAANANPEQANPNADPMDLPISTGLGDGAEYESNTGNPAHSTDDAVAFEATITTHASDFLPGNYPGRRVVLAAAGDRIV